MPDYIEYSIFTKASPELAWDLFCDTSQWNLIPGIYANIRWTQGEPWQWGSRLEYDILKPVPVHVESVLTACIRPQKIGWINHALGRAMEQWVTFEDVPGAGGTKVSVWADTIDKSAVIFGKTAEDHLRDFGHAWYEKFRQECDRLAGSQGKSA